MVSDRGYTTQQVAVFSRPEDFRSRCDKIQQLARQLHVDYTGDELRFMAGDLDEAMTRIFVLARVVAVAPGMVTAG